MPIEWTEALSVGIDEIDNQHKELFKQIDRLLNACNQGKGAPAVAEIIKFLEEYVDVHFKTEVGLMDKYHYPDAPEHKAQHAEFIGTFLDLKKQFETDGPGVHIVILTNRVVVDWLNKHIRRIDKKLGEFLKTKIHAASP